MSATILAAAPTPATPFESECAITAAVITPQNEITAAVISPLDRLISAMRKCESSITSATIRRGELLHRYLGRELEGISGGKRRDARSYLIAQIVHRLRAECLDANVTRLLRIQAVAYLLGRDEAETLPVTVLSEFAPLIEREPDGEEYTFSAPIAAVKDLWRRSIQDRLSHRAVREVANTMLGRQPRETVRRTAAAQLAARATQEDVADFVANLPDDLIDYLADLLAKD
jgi:hypothetical protein